MSKISDIDVNFKVNEKIIKNGFRFYNAMADVFEINGVVWDGVGNFVRMPVDVAKSVSDNVHYLNFNTAGGRVRFKTDSTHISIIAKMDNIGRMAHFALTGSAGFDLYTKETSGYRYLDCFIPSALDDTGYETTLFMGDKSMREYTINFPLYSGVKELLIGLDEDALLESPSEYKIKKPVVYYGSSITQGGCASRPGNSYESIISRRLDCDYVNLGFAGSARAEEEMAEYIKGLDMSVFVYDYDHNAPSVEYLENTHLKMFKIIREANPELPIIMMGRPQFYLDEDGENRAKVIKNTYDYAVSNGDKNVYLIKNTELMALSQDDGMVDRAHPNDFGFASMALAVGDVLECIFKNKKLTLE